MSKPRRSKGKKPWKPKDARDSDNIIRVTDPRESDIIIPVMGPTGVGKSTFINTAAGNAATLVGEDLDSCTDKIQPVIIPYPGDDTRRVVFVDTPGFDDTYVDDTEILRRIAVWLALSYNDGMKMAGIIYLHEISQTRMLGSSHKNFVMFNRLCGVKAVGDVILATTKWSLVTKEVGERREEQLSRKHWKEMLDQGSHLTRFTDSRESAWAIVDMILKNDGINALLIQEELVDLQKRIPATEAGISLRNALQELLIGQRETARQLKKESQENASLRETYEEAERRLRSTLDQIQELTVPLDKRIMAVFFSS